jgi:hypothetical protein
MAPLWGEHMAGSSGGLRSWRGFGLLLVIGGLFFFFGTFVTSDPTHVVCDGQTMRSGDRCISSNGSNSGTYEELVAKARASNESKPGQRPFLILAVLVGAAIVVAPMVMDRSDRTG